MAVTDIDPGLLDVELAEAVRLRAEPCPCRGTLAVLDAVHDLIADDPKLSAAYRDLEPAYRQVQQVEASWRLGLTVDSPSAAAAVVLGRYIDRYFGVEEEG